MASFTSRDSIPFTPYIETNPVDAYLKVGMYKEDQLRQGLQKVQQTVDTLTGLPIMKEEDKQYLQNRLGELKGGISKNLSGDFSDSRIVNQIAGAARTIYSDPVVQNSVQGTMAYQKGQQDIEEARKAGKSNVANETVFNDGAQAWLSDKTVGSKSSQYFTTFTPYTDILGEFKKAWADTNPTEDIPQDAYYYKDGVQHINPVLFKGKGPKQIQAVWNLVKANANVQQQLVIDGKYQFRGQPIEGIYQQLGEQTKASIDQNNKTILALQAKAATGDTEAASHIDDLKQMNVEAEKSLSQYAEALKTNPDAVKAAIVSQQKLSNLIGAYSYQVMEKSFIWEASFEQNKFDVQTREWEMDYNLKLNEFALKQEVERKKAKKDKALEEGIFSLAAVNPLEAVKNEETARQAIVGAQDNYTQSVRETACTMALNGGGQPAFYKDPLTKRWEYNVGTGKPYATKEEADAVTKYYMGEAKDGYINGTLEEPVNTLMEQNEAKYKNLEVAKQRVARIEADYAPQIAQIANTLKEETGGNTQLAQDFVRASTVEKDLPGAKSIEAGLKQKYGEDWKKGMGIVGQGQGEAGYKFGPNERAYLASKNKLNSNPSFSASILAKDQAYQRTQSTEVGYTVTRPTIDSKSREQAILEFTNIVGAVKDLNPSSDKGQYNDFLSLMADKEKDNNVYSSYLNPITGAASLTITRGNKQLTVPIPATELLRKYPEQNTFSAFREQFQPALDLNNGMATGTQFSDAYKANQPSTSPYIVKYHILSTGNGAYRLKWWVGTKPPQGSPSPVLEINGEVMGEKYGLPQEMTEEEIMATINQMKDKTWVEKTLLLNRKLKQGQ